MSQDDYEGLVKALEQAVDAKTKEQSNEALILAEEFQRSLSLLELERVKCQTEKIIRKKLNLIQATTGWLEELPL